MIDIILAFLLGYFYRKDEEKQQRLQQEAEANKLRYERDNETVEDLT